MSRYLLHFVYFPKTENAWVLTRERLAPIAVMQAAYGVLDRFKISRTFFVKTNQADCTILPDPAAKEEIEYKRANVDVQVKSAGVVPDVVVDKVVDPLIEVREMNITLAT